MDGALDSLYKSLPVLIVNGATLLIVVVLLIRVMARVLERGAHELATSVADLRQEVVLLRQDIRDVGEKTAAGMSHLTERVSRIEGKIEGIALSRAPEMADNDDDERTPVGVPIPTKDNVYVDPELVPTPPGKRGKTGPVARVTPAGAYSVVKPKGG